MKNKIEYSIERMNVEELTLHELEFINGGGDGDGTVADKVGYVVGASVGLVVCAAKCVSTWFVQAKIGDVFK